MRFVMRAIVAAMVVLLGAAAAQAQTRTPPLEREAEETARAFRDALERAMKLMDNMLGSIPQYQLPEVLPNGDIIIRRIPTPQAEPPARRPAPPPEPKTTPGGPKMEET
jgi:hypothetical protein